MSLSVIKSVGLWFLISVRGTARILYLSDEAQYSFSQKIWNKFHISWTRADILVNECKEINSFYCVAFCMMQISHSLPWTSRVSNHAMTIGAGTGTTMGVVASILRHRGMKIIVCHLLHCCQCRSCEKLW